jgi:fructokinase
VYVTIGTGVGGGIVIEDRPRHGLVHPELGHVMVRRRADDQFPGLCPYHGDCVEGLVSGPAIAARTGRPAGDLAAAHLVWSDVAAEVAHLFAALVLVVSPERIVVGGGVGTSRSFPLAGVRTGVEAVLGGYVRAFDGNTLVQRAALGDDAGPLGATALGLLAREGR